MSDKKRTRSKPEKKIDLSPDSMAIEPVGTRGGLKVWDEVALAFGITDEEKDFCEIYTNHASYRGNGVKSVIEAWGLDVSKPGVYNNARAKASELLCQPNILNFMRHIFENDGLTDDGVDAELAFAIKQNADLGSKVAAIKHYNEMRGRIQSKLPGAGSQMNFQINIVPAANSHNKPTVQIQQQEPPAQLEDGETQTE